MPESVGNMINAYRTAQSNSAMAQQIAFAQLLMSLFQTGGGFFQWWSDQARRAREENRSIAAEARRQEEYEYSKTRRPSQEKYAETQAQIHRLSLEQLEAKMKKERVTLQAEINALKAQQKQLEKIESGSPKELVGAIGEAGAMAKVEAQKTSETAQLADQSAADAEQYMFRQVLSGEAGLGKRIAEAENPIDVAYQYTKDLAEKPWFKREVADVAMKLADDLGLMEDDGKLKIGEYEESFKELLKTKPYLAAGAMLFKDQDFGRSVRAHILETAQRAFMVEQNPKEQAEIRERAVEMLAALSPSKSQRFKGGRFKFDIADQTGIPYAGPKGLTNLPEMPLWAFPGVAPALYTAYGVTRRGVNLLQQGLSAAQNLPRPETYGQYEYVGDRGFRSARSLPNAGGERGPLIEFPTRHEDLDRRVELLKMLNPESKLVGPQALPRNIHPWKKGFSEAALIGAYMDYNENVNNALLEEMNKLFVVPEEPPKVKPGKR